MSKSVMNHSFSNVPRADIPRSVFDRTHSHKTTFDSGYLVPFYIDEALPGDTFNLNATLFARLATPIVPVMDNMYMDTFYFAVPIRLLWENFQRFMGEQDNPDDSTDYMIPTIDPGGVAFPAGGLEDYFGLPTSTTGELLGISALWHRAYNLIYNQWFRDENLQNSVPINKGDGPDPIADYTLLRRGKRHDYFTSGLPEPQKGPGVEIPLGDSAPISTDFTSGNTILGFDATGASFPTDEQLAATEIGTDLIRRTPSGTGLVIDPNGTLVADLSSATAATINSLRTAFQMQKLLERDSRGGTRYTEIISSHFLVQSPDSRLQRPEYLGGGSQPVNINPVAQTTQTINDSTPQGHLAGFGTVSSHTNGFSKSFTEHCVIIGLVSVRADLTYQRGIPRMFSRSTRYDFYWPVLSHLGEQAILAKEIFADGSANDETAWAYQERWAEYRYYPSKITGKFRSNDPQSLDVWHLSQDFTALPNLNADFIEEKPPIDRVIAVVDEPEFIFDSFIQCRTARPMPTYSVPGMIDHF